MNEPWFDPQYFAWIPGTVLGTLIGTCGGLVGTLAPRGLAKPWMTGLCFCLLSASVVCLIAGIVALISGQPYGVWYGLLLPGFIGTPLMVFGTKMVGKVYRMAEERRMQAHNL